MKLNLYRTQFLPDCTKGNLYVNSKLECFTLELPPAFEGRMNVPDKTCCPEGIFTVVPYESPKRGCMVPLLKDVPGRDEIEMHIGNLRWNTDGCILVGATWCEGNMIDNSVMAFRALMAQLSPAWIRGEAVTIEIGSLFDA